jgi:hypothetical protein
MEFVGSLLYSQWHSIQPHFEPVEYNTHLHILFMQDPFLMTGRELALDYSALHPRKHFHSDGPYSAVKWQGIFTSIERQ